MCNYIYKYNIYINIIYIYYRIFISPRLVGEGFDVFHSFSIPGLMNDRWSATQLARVNGVIAPFWWPRVCSRECFSWIYSLVLNREWGHGMMFNIHYRSFPHSLLSTSKFSWLLKISRHWKICHICIHMYFDYFVIRFKIESYSPLFDSRDHLRLRFVRN